jgi:hypothetical protein
MAPILNLVRISDDSAHVSDTEGEWKRDRAFRHEDPEGDTPWGMQLVVRLEKKLPAIHTAVCEAAAASVVHLLANGRSQSLTVDRQHEEADCAAGNRLRLPLLVLWSQRNDLEDLCDEPLVIWRDWADDVRGHSIDSGHHMAEEAPNALAASLGDFFSSQ